MPAPPARRPSGRDYRTDIAGQLFDLVLSSNQLGTWQLEASTGQVSWDARMFELYGATPDQSEAEVWNRCVDPADRVRVEAAITALLERGGGEVDVHFQICRDDGQRRRIAGRTRLLEGGDGPSFLFGVNWDETDDFEARLRLEEQQHLLEAAMASARMGTYVWDVGRNTVSYSDALYELYGFTRSADVEADRQGLSALVVAEDLDAVRHAAASTLTSHTPAAARFRIRRANDAVERVFEMVSVPLLSSSGDKVVGVVRDITDEVTVVDELRDAQHRYGALVLALPDMLMRIRQDGLIMDFKPAHDSQATTSSFVGRNLSVASPAPPDVTAQVQAAVRAVVAGHGPIVRELDAELPRWRKGTFECRFAASGDDSALLVVRDVTARKAAEREREQALRAAEAAANAKTAFLATVSHEMRTPLNGVLGLAGALADTPLDPQQHRFLAAIQTSGQALLALVDDLLDLTRIEAGGLRVDQTPFDPATTLHEAVEILMPQAQTRGLQLRLHLPEGPRALLQGDPRRLRQVVLNLVGNALKFTERGGVDVTLERTPTAEGEALRIEVRDTGVGIAAADQERVFDAFTQLDNAPTRARGGSGLGLAISRSLVAAMGGTLSLQSELGAGSRFEVRLALPGAEAPRQAPEVPATTLEPGELAVLLVEDNEINQLVAVEQLRGLGVLDVDIAADGAEALELAAARRYDVILMDLQMPRMDGYAATRALRARPGPSQAATIVAMTAHALDDDRARCVDAGMSGYLIKPIDRAALLPWLRRRGEE